MYKRHIAALYWAVSYTFLFATLSDEALKTWEINA
jgi:hypothetical protein